MYIVPKMMTGYLGLLVCCLVVQASEELHGLNVCLRQETKTEEMMSPVREAVQVATKTWCLAIPPRCTTYRTVFKVSYKKMTQQKTEMVKACCEGYGPHPNGSCFACPVGKWGNQCGQECLCANNGTCEAVSGKCQCKAGFQGAQCQEACPPNRYGHNCQETCQCQNGGQCHADNGACNCSTGFCGPHCQTPCSVSLSVCQKCQNGGHCLSNSDTACTCLPGFTGETCEDSCGKGWWGRNCSKACKVCYNQGQCQGTSGVCLCPAGYWGAQCENQCQPGKYGQDCQLDCQCDNAQTCHPVTGQCHCFKGYSGPRCQERACADGKYGVPPACNNTCQCSNLTVCHPLDGSCSCRLGWRNEAGPSCCLCCLLNGGDEQCFRDCGCQNDKYLCGVELNGCVCLPGYSGPECRSSLALDDNSANRAAFLLGSQVAVSKSDNTGLIVGLCMTIIVILLILALALFYRRRLARLQQELANVTYSSSSDVSSSDGADYGLKTVGTAKTTAVHLKNGEAFVKLAEPLPKHAKRNTYVSMPLTSESLPVGSDADRDSIYQSIEYETPAARHQYAGNQYASIDEPDRDTSGRINRAFENQLYNQSHGFAPPSYNAVISETLATTHPTVTLPAK